MEWFACVVNNVNIITWSTCHQVKAKFCFNSSGVFCHVQTCDETKFNGESRDFHEPFINSFSVAFVAARVV